MSEDISRPTEFREPSYLWVAKPYPTATVDLADLLPCEFEVDLSTATYRMRPPSSGSHPSVFSSVHPIKLRASFVGRVDPIPE